MTIVRFPVPPVVKTVTVRAAPARAFSLFVDDFRALVALGADAHRPRPGGLCHRAASRWARFRAGGRRVRNAVGNRGGL